MLSSHGRGIRPLDALKKDSQDLSQVLANYRTIALISHASKVMLKILHIRLQQLDHTAFPACGSKAGLGHVAVCTSGRE